MDARRCISRCNRISNYPINNKSTLEERRKKYSDPHRLLECLQKCWYKHECKAGGGVEVRRGNGPSRSGPTPTPRDEDQCELAAVRGWANRLPVASLPGAMTSSVSTQLSPPAGGALSLFPCCKLFPQNSSSQ